MIFSYLSGKGNTSSSSTRVLVAGPPPPPPPVKDDREWIIVEGCSLSCTPAASSARPSRAPTVQQRPSASPSTLWDLIQVLADGSGPHLDLKSLFFPEETLCSSAGAGQRTCLSVCLSVCRWTVQVFSV